MSSTAVPTLAAAQAAYAIGVEAMAVCDKEKMAAYKAKHVDQFMAAVEKGQSRVHISTHCKMIHASLWADFEVEGFKVEGGVTPLGLFVTVPGV